LLSFKDQNWISKETWRIEESKEDFYVLNSNHVKVASFAKCHHSIHHHLCKKLFLTPTSCKLDVVATHFSSNFLSSKLFPSVLIASSHTLLTSNLPLCGMHVLSAAVDNIFHIQFYIPQKTLRSRTPQLAAGCTMFRSFMIVAPSSEMVVGVVSFSSSWMSLSITQGPRVVSTASTTARHAFVSATACLQMYPSPPSTE